MSKSILLRTRISRLLLNGHSVITFTLGIASLLLAMGFLFINPTGTNTTYSNILSANVWGILFYAYGVSKVIVSLYRTPYVIKILSTISGLWLWTFLSISLLLVDSITAPIELMILTPILCEVWDFSITILNRRIPVNKREFNVTVR